MNNEGTRTGRFSSRDPNYSNGPRADTSPTGRLGALQAAVERLQAAGACVLRVHQPIPLREALAARSEADAAALRERLLATDYRHLEERVLAHMADGATFDESAPFALAQWQALGRNACAWDNWKPMRDVA